MKPAAARIALLLSLSIAGATPSVAAAAPLAGVSPGRHVRSGPAVVGTKDERAATATAQYEQNRPVEAALGFEGLWKDYPGEIDFLFNAATSRFAAGHFAHAIVHTDEYLAVKTIGEAERKAAEAQRRAAVVQTGAAAVTVRLGAPPAGDAGVEIVAQFVPRDSGDIRPDLMFKTAPQRPAMLQLDPGTWIVRSHATDHEPAEQRIEVTKGQTLTVGLDLKPAPQDTPPVGVIDKPKPPREVPPAVARRFAVGFGVAGGVVAAAGIGVVAFGSSQLSKARECTGDPMPCGQALTGGVTNRGAGFTVLGVGVGLLAGGLPWLAKDAGVRKKVWIAESVIGGAAAVAGMVVLGLTRSSFVSTIAGGERAPRAASHVAGNMMFGLGAGTAISAITGLIVQRHHLRKPVAVGASAARGQFGLTLSGRF